jgi:predicted AlkP superfamily phosphohydrolase/phosphomutase
MTVSSPLVVVGLDACDPAVARRLAAEGHLPTLARLFERAARCTVHNAYGLFVGALWTTFASGLRPDRHHFHCWDEIDVASYVRQLTAPPSRAETTFWSRLSAAGRRVAVLDVPHSRADAPINGLQVVEWGCHDRHFGFHAWPPKSAAEIEAGFGLHPVLGIDPYAVREFAPDDYAYRSGALRTTEEERALLDGLLRGVKAKRTLSAALLAGDKWDLFIDVFGESHSVGHQQWHLHDSTHPRFNPATVAALDGDPILKLYRELDSALGEIVSVAGDEATVLVLLSHGMGPHNDGTHLLDAILTRIDVFNRHAPVGERKPLRRALENYVTAFAVPMMRRVARANLLPSCPEYASPEQRARQCFFMEPNNYVYGGIRLNLAGREPMGCVEPGEVGAVCQRLSDDLLALVNLDTGGPVIRAVERADRWYRRSADDTMPDLFVDWERSAPIETVWSPKTGLVHARYTNWRSGDHRPDGLLLAYGPRIPANTTLPGLATEDLAPSIAARLGVKLEDIDGRAASWLT